MQTAGIDWLLVPICSDLRYLTGYKAIPLERLTLFLLPKSGVATFLMPQFEVAKLTQEGYEVFYDVSGWEETQDPYALLASIVGVNESHRIAVSDALWSIFLLGAQKVLPKAEFVSAKPVMSELRLRKDAQEIESLRELGRRMDRVAKDAANLRYAGRTEREVGWDIFMLVNEHGLAPTRAGGVASGPNTASAHHMGGNRLIEEGDAVWIELGQGGNWNGYIADMTRVYHVGEPSQEFRDVYEVVKRAQRAARESVRPGVACQDVDRTARRIISEAGFGKYFTHRVGHGLGLEVHEDPYMVEGNERPLVPGMVFSVEPGVYLPDRFGIRIEDIVYVTDEGYGNIYAATHDYVIVQ
jgi:Xaa-Pro aminopeptidase